MFDDVILRNVGGLIGDVIPCTKVNGSTVHYLCIEYIIKFKNEPVWEGWREGGNPSYTLNKGNRKYINTCKPIRLLSNICKGSTKS